MNFAKSNDGAGGINIALYQPEIPQNTAAILRTAACFGAPLSLIGAPAFDLSQRRARRAGLDYAQDAVLKRHDSFADFLRAAPGRVILLTTHGDAALDTFWFAPGDTLLFGQESAGVPQSVHEACHARVRIPMAPGKRSLNLAVSVGIALWQAINSANATGGKGLS